MKKVPVSGLNGLFLLLLTVSACVYSATYKAQFQPVSITYPFKSMAELADLMVDGKMSEVKFEGTKSVLELLR